MPKPKRFWVIVDTDGCVVSGGAYERHAWSVRYLASRPFATFDDWIKAQKSAGVRAVRARLEEE